jgi:hypothetical protein
VWKLHSACRNHTLSVEITLERVVSTLVSVIFTHIRVKITRVCVWNHTAYGNRTLRVEMNLVLVKTTLVRVVFTFVAVEITLRVKITLWVYKSHS